MRLATPVNREILLFNLNEGGRFDESIVRRVNLNTIDSKNLKNAPSQ